MKRILSFSFLFSLSLSLSAAAFAQSCTTAVCNAASPNESDVLAALPSSNNTNQTVVVNIPSGTSSWTTGFSYTVPSAVTNLTIQGNTTVNCTGTAGTSSYACTASDGTIIQDSLANNNSVMTFTINGTGTLFRMTGLTIEGGNIGSPSNNKYNGELSFWGNSQNFRFDHNHLNNTTFAPATNSSWLRTNGAIIGVLDHNLVDLGDQTNTANGFQIFSVPDDSIGWGDGSWHNGTEYGTSNFVFMENNVFNGGAPDDCTVGARFVMRYNTISAAYIGIQTHGLKTTGGSERSCLAYEAYHNYFTGPGGASTTDASTGSKGGTALLWGNTMNGASYRFYVGATDRNTTNQLETPPPTGWGYCGTSVTSGSTGSAWDGNSTAAAGYPCMDGLGRGQDTQALNGQPLPSALNSVTGGIAWPQQYLEPIYMWGNSIGSATYVEMRDLVTTNNQDYYFDCGSQNPSCSSFTGAAGTGYGVLAARPSTCTPGPGGIYGASPTGSEGVGYFATDANSGNGELYVCTSTNTWTGIYQPYTYPHPLVSGGGSTTAAAPPPAPTNLISTVL